MYNYNELFRVSLDRKRCSGACQQCIFRILTRCLCQNTIPFEFIESVWAWKSFPRCGNWFHFISAENTWCCSSWQLLAAILKLIRFLHPQHYPTLFVSQWFWFWKLDFVADLSFKGRPKPRQRLILESSTTWLASSRAISSQAFVQFREGIQKLHGDDCFVEFLQQLFPWVSITAGASSAACQIRSATDEISKFLHAAHDDDREGFVRLIRSTTERPRTFWSQLLHGPKTIRFRL